MKEKIACMLCLQKKENFVRLCSKKGLHLQCTELIVKHFPWLKAEAEKNNKQRVCLVCLRAVRDFHGFYQSVAKAHNHLDDNNLNITFCDSYATDVLSDEESTGDPLPAIVKTEEVTIEENLNADVKLEEGTLPIEVLEIVEAPIDLAPSAEPAEACALYNEATTDFHASDESTEVRDLFKWEDPEDAVIEAPKSGRALRASRRSQRKDIKNETEIKLLIKKESLPSVKKGKRKTDDDDSDVWLPASLLSKKIAKNAQPKKRGRPFKSYENEIEMQAAQINLKTEDEHELGQHTASFNAHTVDYDSSDNLSDTDRPERWAEIVAPRSPEKPRKRRIRLRPQSSYRRMTQEEKDIKRLEQERFDEIIAKFFDNFPCPKCQHLVCTFGEMRKHFNARHSATKASVLCCGRKFSERRSLSDHVLFHLNPEHFKCSQCGQCLPDGSALRKHAVSHNPVPEEEKPKFNCEKCPAVFSSKSSLRNHTFAKHIPESEYQFPCQECSKRFPTKYALENHLSVHKKGAKSVIVICEQCGKTLGSKSALKYHIDCEHSNVPRARPERVECPICKMSLCSSYTLKQHMISLHEEPKNVGEFRCHICGWLSVNGRALKKHINYNHKTEAKFQCTMCPKAFKKKETLKEHIAMHTGEGKTTCPECQMTFACKANYHKHKQRRHGFKPVKRNLIGLAEKKRQKLQAAAENQTEILLDYSTEGGNETTLAISLLNN